MPSCVMTIGTMDIEARVLQGTPREIDAAVGGTVVLAFEVAPVLLNGCITELFELGVLLGSDLQRT